jgi:hypothetical protein
MFGTNSRLEDIEAELIDLKIEIKALNNAFAKMSTQKLGDRLSISKDISKIMTKLDDMSTDHDTLGAGIMRIIKNQEEILANQNKKPKRKKRSKPLTHAGGWKSVTKEEAQSFKEMYDRGLSITEITVSSGRAPSTISKWLRKLGVEEHD